MSEARVYAVVGALVLILACASEANKPDVDIQATISATLEQALQGTSPLTTPAFGDSTHIVGTDIEPGTYITGRSSGCSWQRLSGLSGAASEVIDSGSGASQIVTISPSDAGFISESCGDWTRVE